MLLLWTFLYKFSVDICFISPGYLPRSVTAGTHDNSVFNIVRNCQAVCQSGCTLLHSRQQCMRVPSAPHLHFRMKQIQRTQPLPTIESFLSGQIPIFFFFAPMKMFCIIFPIPQVCICGDCPIHTEEKHNAWILCGLGWGPVRSSRVGYSFVKIQKGQLDVWFLIWTWLWTIIYF